MDENQGRKQFLCPVCGSSDLSEGVTVKEALDMIHGKFTLYTCNSCGLGVIQPVPTEEKLKTLYSDDFYSRPLLSEGILSKLSSVVFYPRRKRVERHVTRGKLFDYGCGDGRFAEYMAERGWDVTGFDFSPTAQKLTKNNPRLTLFSDIAEVDALPHGTYDCVTMWQVLEHIPDPVALLSKLARILKPDGVFMISVPNFGSLQAQLTGNTWWGLDVPRHLVHFTPGSLEKTFDSAELTMVSTNHLLLQYAPYSFFHSMLDKFFTRRHFLSNLLKHTLPAKMTAREKSINFALLILLAPILLPLSMVEPFAAALLRRGAFIEVIAKPQKKE